MALRSGMGRLAVPVLVLVVTVAGVAAIANATQYKGGRDQTGATRVEFSVETRNYHHGLDHAATVLWSTCTGAIGWASADAPKRVTGNRYVAEVRPKLGEHSSRRLRGCLEDVVISRIRGDVTRTSITD